MTLPALKRVGSPSLSDLPSVESALASGQGVVVQFVEAPYPLDVLAELNRLAERYSTLLEIRFFGHYTGGFDCSTLASVPSVSNLGIDSLRYAENLHELTRLERLERLSLGVFELASADFLSASNLRRLKHLTLAPTRKRVIDLALLRDYSQLEGLGVCGHTRGMQALGRLSTIRDLSLNSIPKSSSLRFVSDMDGLRALHVLLGGRASIAEVECPALEELEVIRVRGLMDVGDLGRFPLLQRFEIQDQLLLEQIAFSEANRALEQVTIYNCKSLRALPGLERVPRLSRLRIFETAIEPSSLRRDRLSSSLTVVTLGTGKALLDRKIRAQRAVLGYESAPKPKDVFAIDWRQDGES